MSMTDAEIREALARAERATPGPWHIGATYRCHVWGGGPIGRPKTRHVATVFEETNDSLFVCCARTDVPRLAADLLAARAERGEARAALATPTLAKHQPCGCVVCTCGDVERCGGCGARMCDRHRDDRPSLANDPATVWEAHPLLARAEAAETELAELRRWKDTHSVGSTLRTRAERAEARCRELEVGIAEMLQAFDGTDVALQARMIDRLRALLSPPPSHTCQIHRATSGASDCGLEPCEEATVHTDQCIEKLTKRIAALAAVRTEERKAERERCIVRARDAIACPHCADHEDTCMSREEMETRIADAIRRQEG